MRLAFSCVAEDLPGYHARVLMLVTSLRGCGGSAADAPVLVNMLEKVDPAFQARLEDFGAEVIIVPRLVASDDAGGGTPNKLRMLEVGDRDDFDVLIASDCDVAVAADPTPYVAPDAITVVPADQDALNDRQWRFLLKGLGVPDAGTILTAATGRRIRPYFNSGVIAVPREQCEPLSAAWRKALDDVLELWRSDPPAIPPMRRFFSDQYALAAALQRGLPWRAGDRALNFPTHVPVRVRHGHHHEPALMHYHHEIDPEGFLLAPISPMAREAAERANRARAEALGLQYTGLRDRPVRERLGRWAIRRRAAVGDRLRQARAALRFASS